MYRRLVPLWVLLYALLPLVIAYAFPGSSAALARLVGRTIPDGPGAGGTFSLALGILLTNLVPLAAGLGLAWVSAFDPGRRHPLWEKALRAAGALGLALYSTGFLLHKAQAAANAGVLLAGQAGKPPWLLMTAAQAPHGLLEGVAHGLVFTVPLFWLVRAPQVRSFARTSFEAWAEARRLTIPALLLLAVAAIIEVMISPATTAMVLK